MIKYMTDMEIQLAQIVKELRMQVAALEVAMAELEDREQEPVAWMTIDPSGEEDDIWYNNPEGKLLAGWTYKPLYTTPQPKREWVGLTDEEIREVYQNYLDNPDDTWDYERAIEQALKEKNT